MTNALAGLDEWKKKIVKNILATYSTDISAKNFKPVYDAAIKAYENDLTAGAPKYPEIITQILFNIRINPLEYMEEVPRYFLYWSDIKDFTIPNNVKIIRENAFARSEIKNIKISEILEIIERYAFANCKNLEYIEFPSTIKEIKLWAFKDCRRLWDAYFDMTADELKKIYYDIRGGFDLERTRFKTKNGYFKKPQ